MPDEKQVESSLSDHLAKEREALSQFSSEEVVAADAAMSRFRPHIFD
jgi:hypothetical protein